MAETAPFPDRERDGYELEVVEQSDGKNHAFLPAPIPTDEARFAVKPGDIVKLIFLYRDWVEKEGRTFTGEHMWVRIVARTEGRLTGQLDNDPQYSTILRADDTVVFRPTHIVQIWTD